MRDGNMRNRNSGSNGRYKRVVLLLALLPILAWAEQIWTDFSPKPEVVYDIAPEPTKSAAAIVKEVQEVQIEARTDETGTENLDKEKYRSYFEDKSLVLMVLGGVEYWKMNCGELSVQGNYFMKLAIKKHEIDEEEMHMDMSFQTGLFAAQLYNSCDHFLQQVKSIGLDMMFVVDPDVVPSPEAINNISNPET